MPRVLPVCFFLVACAASPTKSGDIAPALELLRSSDSADRFEAVIRLGQSASSEQAHEALVGAIKDGDAAVRLMAVIALLAADSRLPTKAVETNAVLTPNPSKSPIDVLDVVEQLVYEDPWFAGTLMPGIAWAARDKDERLRNLARRALEVLARNEPLDFRREVLAMEQD